MACCDLSKKDHKRKCFISLGLFVAMWLLLVVSIAVAVTSEGRCEKKIAGHDLICLRDPDIEGCDIVLEKLGKCMIPATLAASLLTIVATVSLIAASILMCTMCCCSSPPENEYDPAPVAESPSPVARRGASRHVFQPPAVQTTTEETAAAPLLAGQDRV